MGVENEMLIFSENFVLMKGFAQKLIENVRKYVEEKRAKS
jgi:hypothetical protein